MIVRRTYNWPRWYSRSLFEELENMKRQMSRMFEGGSKGIDRTPAAGVFPLLNVGEEKDNYRVRAELPGIKAEDLDISITGNSLAISGERKIPAENETGKYHRREREAGKFSRMISLPGEVDVKKVEARCADGILSILLPKAEAAKPRQISVN